MPEIRSVARDGATAQAAGTISRNTRHSARCQRLSGSHASGEGQPKALAHRNGLATPVTVNQFSVAARQQQRDLASEGGSRTLHDRERSACRVGQAAARLPSGTM
jgi:hypothetical protein